MPEFVVAGAGLQNGGLLTDGPYPSRDQFFGDAVANALEVIAKEGGGLSDYSLDGDRGYGWNGWHPKTGTVPSLSSVVVQCPDPLFPIVENNGHECVFAEAYIPAFDDLNAPLDPADDRHVGQRNEQLVLAPKGCRPRTSPGSAGR